MEINQEREILSVSQLNASVKFLLEENFGQIWVEGEISNLAAPSSGHLYFTLKDTHAQISCAYFKQRQFGSLIKIANGMQVLVRATASLYENRGNYQLIVSAIEDIGFGKLQKAYEQLKQKLAAEGLFDNQYKKPLPVFAKTLGIITSPSGAAIRDVLTVLHRRFPLLKIIIYPCQVQGALAAEQIVSAINIANIRSEVDLLLVTRGGGSLEDLWSFNEEVVARAIFKSALPVISAVGHEIDFTISDFVADVRAPTPSAAAELLSLEQNALQETILFAINRLQKALRLYITQQQQYLLMLHKRLRHPHDILHKQMQRIDLIEQQLKHLMLLKLANLKQILQNLSNKNQFNSPKQKIAIINSELKQFEQRLALLIKQKTTSSQHQLQILMRALNQISPLATLERGYSITFDNASGLVIDSIDKIHDKQILKTKLKDGVVMSRVIEV